jgi:zinc protease
MSLPRRIAPAVLALAVAGCSVGRPTVHVPADIGSPVRHTLANGMTVVVQQHRASDLVSLQLWVRAGARDEGPSERGLAHYLEHMVFKGTPSRAPGAVARGVEEVGGRINAATAHDYTYYDLVVPTSDAASAVELLADVSVNASLDGALLEDEKRVVLEEMRRGDDAPRRFLGRRLFALLFGDHPYGRPVIGEAGVIRGLSRETLNSFYRRHYVPESFVLVVVGAVAPDTVVAIASRAFGRLPRTPAARLPVGTPAGLEPRQEDIPRPGTLAHLGLGWHAPRLDHADTPAMSLLAAMLGRGRSSRLTQALRERQGVVTSVSASYTAFEAVGALTVTCLLPPSNLERAEAGVVAELRRLRDAGPSDAELRRAVIKAEAHHEFSVETADGRAHALGRAEAIWRLDEELAWLDRLRAVTHEQIRAAARRYLDPDRYVRVALVPDGER